MISNRIEPIATRESVCARRTACVRNAPRRGGFTLIELLIVILIILIISAVALPTIIPAISHRQVSEAGRILQGALVGSRDAAIHNNTPSGIRLLPDPTLIGIITSTGLVDPTQALAYNRVIPIQSAPAYTEGRAIPYFGTGNFAWQVLFNATLGQVAYPGPATQNLKALCQSTNALLVYEEIVSSTTNLPNPPTSWFWNIRVGDKIQINNSGLIYTVVGPMVWTPVNGNNEMFVNVGAPGTTLTWLNGFSPEFLFLVNGQDDNNNGWVDEGWDGVDNDGFNGIDDIGEWVETEAWGGSITKLPANVGQPYIITRRPAPTANAREVSLPTNVVIDATTLLQPPTGIVGGSRERSRFPVNLFTGYVDILVNPNGSVVPTTIYSSPSSYSSLAQTFYHFWLAERSDVTAPAFNTLSTTNPGGPPYLPIPKGLAPTLFSTGAELKGEYRLITLNARTGQISADEEMGFDSPANISAGTYNPSVPFLEAQLGVRGGP
jgi:prepilin-type N-terminal cleavage/methylation domain-containing protein